MEFEFADPEEIRESILSQAREKFRPLLTPEEFEKVTFSLANGGLNFEGPPEVLEKIQKIIDDGF